MQKDNRGYSDLEYMTYDLVQEIIETVHDFLLTKPDHYLARNKNFTINPLTCKMTSGIVLKIAKCDWAPVGVCTILGGSELWTGSNGNFRKILPDILALFGAEVDTPMHKDEHFLYYAIKQIGRRKFASTILDQTAPCFDSELKACQAKWKKISTNWYRTNNRKRTKKKP